MLMKNMLYVCSELSEKSPISSLHMTITVAVVQFNNLGL